MSNVALEVMVRSIIKDLEKAGIEDITSEDIFYKIKGKVLKFRLYTTEQWEVFISNKNEATQIMSKLGVSTESDHKITYDDKVYHIKLIK